MIDTGRLAALFGLEGKVVVVTGGGAGFGAAIAALLAAAGATVAVADRDEAAAERTVAAIRAAGGSAQAQPVDVADEPSVERMFQAVAGAIGEVDILVSNVGVFPKQYFTETTAAQWDGIHSVNLRGAFLCMRAAAQSMIRKGGGGRIVCISSIASLHPATYGNAAYSASKGGLNALVRGAALDLVRHGITVNAVLPGGVRTETGNQLGRSGTITGPATDERRFLLGWKDSADPVAAAVLYLAGHGGAHVTGQSLVVDGGFMIS
ncbi:MAG: SDR family NAD(P)-dependent oxidoreductase [Gammaproteobacteria bacterium]